MKKSLAIAGLIVLALIVIYYIYTSSVSKQNSMSVTSVPSSAVTITPIMHASLVLNWASTTLYVDPVGSAELYADAIAPTAILITHEHPDHFSTTTLEALVTPDTIIVAPESIAKQLTAPLTDHLVVLKNGDKTTINGIAVEAVPAYNLREEDATKHPKGRDNGYVLEANGERVYIAGDTEDIPEMRSLKNIDIAFVPMNLPYTMSVEKAADAVLAFKPKHVYPYHYRTPSGLSDVAKFKQLVNDGDTNIDVELLNWYPDKI